MIHRIEKAGIFAGLKRITNAEALRKVNDLKTMGKPIGSGGRFNEWMKELCFRKEYHRDKTPPYILRLWWVRE
jgi:hypothetical protein